MRKFLLIALLCFAAVGLSARLAAANEMQEAAVRLKASKRAMFLHWGLATFLDIPDGSAPPTEPITTFNPTGCDTDQWARTAKAAGMGSLLFVTIHGGRFALWDTATTDRKVTNSPLGIDVLAKVRQSCDKYGLGLGLYYCPAGNDPDLKKAQMQELLTNYGDIDYMFFEGGLGDGGLGAEDTVNFVHGIQSDCLTTLTEIHDIHWGTPSSTVPPPFLMNDVSFTALGIPGQGWFYTNPGNDNVCRSTAELVDWYTSCEAAENLLLLGLGPDRAGRLRDIDVARLTEVGQLIGVPEPGTLTMILSLGIVSFLYYVGRRRR